MTPFPVDTYKRAGLTGADIARLMNVTRVTANNWLAGAGIHFHLRDKVMRVTIRVEAALAAGRLPVNVKGRSVDVRESAIHRAVFGRVVSAG